VALSNTQSSSDNFDGQILSALKDELSGKAPAGTADELEKKFRARTGYNKLRKIRQACNQVFRYTIVTSRAKTNPASELTSALTPPKSMHYPHLLADELADFLQALAAYSGN